jgi:Flp pilus assembly protein protease CpaA
MYLNALRAELTARNRQPVTVNLLRRADFCFHFPALVLNGCLGCYQLGKLGGACAALRSPRRES